MFRKAEIRFIHITDYVRLYAKYPFRRWAFMALYNFLITASPAYLVSKCKVYRIMCFRKLNSFSDRQHECTFNFPEIFLVVHIFRPWYFQDSSIEPYLLLLPLWENNPGLNYRIGWLILHNIYWVFVICFQRIFLFFV